MPKNKIKITLVALATLGLGIAGVSTAVAGPPHAAPTPPAATASSDSDNVQEGDQTTPDVPGAVEEPEATSSEATEAEATEAEGAEAEGAEESGPSDGNDGGHADPEGVDVNHVGDANEK